PEPTRLKGVRQEIDYNLDEFKNIITTNEFISTYKDIYKGSDQSLTTVPKGYEKDNPAIDYLKLKSFISETTVADAELLKATLHKKTVTAFKVLQPFLNFINRTIEE
ncbi:MAG: DUF2461 domain-containing protein, partial [Bacteroidota bacterium]|nr:DUF2461 domain-containing protein [Bacteroidota bacterium]